MSHLKRVADQKDNKMDAKNLATVFSPNLVHASITEARRPESIISEMELNNVIIELLISNVDAVFDYLKLSWIPRPRPISRFR